MKILNLKIPPIIVWILTALLMWASSLVLPQSNWNLLIRLMLCIFFVVFGGVITLIGVLQFHKTKTTLNPTSPNHTKKLVCDGIYKYTRNPMYLGFTFMLIGGACFLGKIILLFWVGIFIFYITQFQIKPEEKILQKKFEKDFEKYKKSVRRWI